MLESQVTFAVVTIAIITFLINVVSWWRRIRSLPPGPWGLPLIGYVPWLKTNRHLVLTKLRGNYGDVFSIQLGSYFAVVINGLDTIREALVKKGEIFSGRPPFHSLQYVENGRGFAFADYGPRWKVRRTIALNGMKEFVHKRLDYVDTIISKEANKVAMNLLNTRGKPYDPEIELFLAAGTVTYEICFGYSVISREDPDFIKLVKRLRDFTENMGATNKVDLLPWLRYFQQERLQKFIKINLVSRSLVQKQEDKHLQNFNPNDLRDILDFFLLASSNVSDDVKKQVGLEDGDITIIAEDLIRAGTATVSTTLTWIVAFLAKNPEIQAALQKEVDEVVGRNRSPAVSQRNLMPYTESFITESQRMWSIAPLLLPHYTTGDATLKGYRIPKGTLTIINAWSVDRDPTLWENPNKLIPNRFLKSNGEFDKEKAELLMTFGVGRRRCLGEIQAKMELFTFVTTLVQKCHFEEDPNQPIDMEPTFGLVLHSKPYKVIITERNMTNGK